MNPGLARHPSFRACALFYAVAEAGDGVRCVTAYVKPEDGERALRDAERRAAAFRAAAERAAA